MEVQKTRYALATTDKIEYARKISVPETTFCGASTNGIPGLDGRTA